MNGAFFPTKFHGNFRIHACEECGAENMALIYGKLKTRDAKPILVRLHSKCTTGDVFHSMRCDCGEQLEKSMEMIGKQGAGVLIYLDQEGRGIGRGVGAVEAGDFQAGD